MGPATGRPEKASTEKLDLPRLEREGQQGGAGAEGEERMEGLRKTQCEDAWTSRAEVARAYREYNGSDRRLQVYEVASNSDETQSQTQT